MISKVWIPNWISKYLETKKLESKSLMKLLIRLPDSIKFANLLAPLVHFYRTPFDREIQSHIPFDSFYCYQHFFALKPIWSQTMRDVLARMGEWSGCGTRLVAFSSFWNAFHFGWKLLSNASGSLLNTTCCLWKCFKRFCFVSWLLMCRLLGRCFSAASRLPRCSFPDGFCFVSAPLSIITFHRYLPSGCSK